MAALFFGVKISKKENKRIKRTKEVKCLMKLAAVLLGLILVIMEIARAGRIKTPTSMLFMMLSNFVLLHAWIVVGWLSDSLLAVSEETVSLILISDFAFVLCSIYLISNKNKLRFQNIIYTADGYEAPTKILFAAGVILSAYYLSKVGISVFSSDVEYSRHTNKKGYGYLLIFLIYAAPMCATYFYIGSGKNKWRSYYCLAAVVLLQILTGFRAYLVTVIMALYFANSYKEKRFSVKGFIGLIAILGIIFVAITNYRLMTDLRAKEFDMQALIERISDRVFTELPLQIDRLVFIADTNGFTNGQSYLWDLQSALPGPGESLGDRMLVWIDASNELSGVVPLTPSIIGEGYLNFGSFGVFISSLIIGIGCVYLDKRPIKTKMDIVTYGYFSVFMLEAIIVGIGGTLSSRVGPYMFFMLILYVIRLHNQAIKK